MDANLYLLLSPALMISPTRAAPSKLPTAFAHDLPQLFLRTGMALHSSSRKMLRTGNRLTPTKMESRTGRPGGVKYSPKRFACRCRTVRQIRTAMPSPTSNFCQLTRLRALDAPEFVPRYHLWLRISTCRVADMTTSFELGHAPASISFLMRRFSMSASMLLSCTSSRTMCVYLLTSGLL